ARGRCGQARYGPRRHRADVRPPDGEPREAHGSPRPRELKKLLAEADPAGVLDVELEVRDVRDRDGDDPAALVAELENLVAVHCSTYGREHVVALLGRVDGDLARGVLHADPYLHGVSTSLRVVVSRTSQTYARSCTD